MRTREVPSTQTMNASELRQHLENSRSRWIEARCLPEMQTSALHAIIDLATQELSLSASAAAEGAKRLQDAGQFAVLRICVVADVVADPRGDP